MQEHAPFSVTDTPEHFCPNRDQLDTQQLTFAGTPAAWLTPCAAAESDQKPHTWDSLDIETHEGQQPPEPSPEPPQTDNRNTPPIEPPTNKDVLASPGDPDDHGHHGNDSDGEQGETAMISEPPRARDLQGELWKRFRQEHTHLRTVSDAIANEVVRHMDTANPELVAARTDYLPITRRLPSDSDDLIYLPPHVFGDLDDPNWTPRVPQTEEELAVMMESTSLEKNTAGARRVQT